MLYDDLAQKLFGAKRAESNAVLTDATTGTIHGRALTDSADGSVVVEITGDVTNPDTVEIGGEVYYGDADTGIEIPTSENVKAGDEVLVSVYGEGTMRSPAVTSAIGSGDRVAADATAAREIAEATGQHFWDDDSGAHVTELPRDEWEQQQTGPNSLWNSLGMLFRDGLNNLLSLTTAKHRSDEFSIVGGETEYELFNKAYRVTSVTIDGASYDNYQLIKYSDGTTTVRIGYNDTYTYQGAALFVEYDTSSALSIFDGFGNQEDNIAAQFDADSVRIGKTSGSYAVFSSDGLSLVDEEGTASIFTRGEVGLLGQELRLWVDNEFGPMLFSSGGISLLSQFGHHGAYTGIGVVGSTAWVSSNTVEFRYFDGETMLVKAVSFPMADVIAALKKAIRLGTTYSDSKNVAIAANTDIMGASVNVPAGTYLVICWQTFLNPGSSGQRTTTIGTYSGGSLASYTTAVQATRDQVRVQHMNIITTTGSSTTLQAYARSNIAASGNNNSQINAVCIG